MRPIQSITTCLRKSFQFSGRASRSEFWWFAPIGMALPIEVGSQLNWRTTEMYNVLNVGVMLLSASPLASAMSRRVHDTDRPGWYPQIPIIVATILIFWLFTSFRFVDGAPYSETQEALEIIRHETIIFVWLACFASFVTLLAMLCGKSTPGPNRYGPNPLEVTP